MSSMLEQAIIEAEQLKKVAARNAEQVILEKYSKEIKGEMENLIEQELGLDDPAGLGLGMDAGAAAKPEVDFEGAKADNDQVPDQLEYAAFDGLTIGETKYPKEGDLIEINLDSLSEYELNPEAGPTARNLSESIEIDDSLLEQFINEELEEDKVIDKDKKKDDEEGDDKKPEESEDTNKEEQGEEKPAEEEKEKVKESLETILLRKQIRETLLSQRRLK